MTETLDSATKAQLLRALLDGRLPPGFNVPMPSDDPTLREDEDPLEPGDLDLGLAPRVSEGEGE